MYNEDFLPGVQISSVAIEIPVIILSLLIMYVKVALHILDESKIFMFVCSDYKTVVYLQ